jgi:hypothetical protein
MHICHTTVFIVGVAASFRRSRVCGRVRFHVVGGGRPESKPAGDSNDAVAIAQRF